MKFFEALQQQYVLPVLRFDDSETCDKIMNCFIECGWPILEVTLTTPNALELIKKYSEQGLWIGAGSVKSEDDAKSSLEAGAKFFVSPGYQSEVDTFTRERGLPYLPGVSTPTEVMNALDKGFKYVKVFPISLLGGPSFIKSIKGPIPELELIPTGGIGPNDIEAYKKAGAFAVGIGGSLIPKDLLQQKDFAKIKTHLKTLIESL